LSRRSFSQQKPTTITKNDNDVDSAATVHIEAADLAPKSFNLEEQSGDGMGSQQVTAPGWETCMHSIQCSGEGVLPAQAANNNMTNTGNHQSLITTSIPQQ
jgi:hypothetical protein